MLYLIVHRRRTLTIYLLSIFVMVCISGSLLGQDAYAATKPKPKPQLTLNVARGPLGVKLSMNGKNFHPGQASLSYVDALNIPGIFTVPGDSTVLVAQDGTFLGKAVTLPANGPSGMWKIVVTDSAGAVVSVGYDVLVAPGAAAAGVPAIVINPVSGKPGDQIAFTGSNWLPQGTSVKLTLMFGTTTLPLLHSPLVSDSSGTIMGSFYLPQSSDPTVTSATVLAVDSSGALQAQTQLTLLSLSPTPSASPTAGTTPTPVSVTHVAPPSNGPDITMGAVWAFLGSDGAVITLLIVGGSLGIAALMLILFLAPWGERRQKHTRSRQW